MYVCISCVEEHQWGSSKAGSLRHEPAAVIGSLHNLCELNAAKEEYKMSTKSYKLQQWVQNDFEET